MNPLLKKKRHSGEDKYLLRKYCFLSAVFTLGIMLIFYLFHNNTLLFGDKTVLRMDLYHQYGPLYAEVYDRITNGNSLVYSWTSGLGGNFLGNFFNYCCSPFALFMLLCGHKNMPEAIALMIMFKAIMASSAFTYYINKSNRSVKRESIFFGILYAFCGYFVAYSWNIMWLDAMAIFPLVILGIEKIIQHNKPSLYVFSLTYTMITNYYMAYMVCILSVIYFLFFYFAHYELASPFCKNNLSRDENKAVQDQTSADLNGETPLDAPLFSYTENKTSEENDYNIAEEAAKTENDLSVFDDFSETANVDSETVCADIEIIETVCTDTENTETAAVLSLSPEEEIVNDKQKKRKKRKKTRKQPLTNRRFWITGWTFALSSLLCFLLAGFALIPVYFCLRTSSATQGKLPEDPKIYFDIFNFIANHLPAVETTIRSSGDNVIPNVYCGLITFMLIPFYFFSNKIPGRQKVASSILLITFYCGFVLNYFNFIWHGMHMPNDLPYRYSFAYSFVLLILAYKVFEHIDEFSNKAYIGMGFAALCFIILAEKFSVPNCKEPAILISVIFTILYVVIFGMLKSPTYKRDAVIGILLFTIILEVTISDAPKLIMSQPKESYVSDYQAYRHIKDQTEAEENELFYRTELSKLRTRMDPCWYGYNGVSTFSSMAYEHIAKIVKKVGLFGNNINSYTYYPQTPIFNSMFALKYIYDNNNENLINSEYIYNELSSNDKFSAYEYKYFLPLAFSVNNDISDWDTSSSNPFTVQNEFMRSATGVSNILTDVEATSFDSQNIDNVGLSEINSGTTFSVKKTQASDEGKATVKIDVKEEGEYYVYAGSTHLSSLTIDAESFHYNYVSSAIEPLTMDLGYLPVDTEIKITYTISKEHDSATIAFCAAKLDLNKFEEAYNKILDNGIISLNNFDETKLGGTINIRNDNAFLYTSIPYDDGWKIFVDGKQLSYPKKDAEGKDVENTGDIIKIGNAFIGFKLEKGEHEINFRYNANGLWGGIKLTIYGLIIIILLIILKRWILPRLDKKNKTPYIFRKPDYFIN